MRLNTLLFGCLLTILYPAVNSFGQKPELVVQTGHSSSVFSVAIIPDGKTLASGSNDNTIKLWDLASGKQLYSLNGHSNSIKAVVFSPDGKTLASGSADDTVKIWDVVRGVEVRSLKPGEHINSVAMSPTGKTLASIGWSSVKLWDLFSGNQLWSFTLKHAGFSGAFSPDGRILAIGSYSEVILLEVASGKELFRLRHADGNSLESVNSVVFSPDGLTLVSASKDKIIKMWDIVHRSELRMLEGHASAVSAVVFTPDGKTLASGSEDDTIKLWDPVSGKELRTLTAASNVYSLAFTPDGGTLASGVTDPLIKLWKVSDGTEMPPLVGHSSPTQSVAFSPDGMTLASGSHHSVIVWDLKNGNEVRLLNGHSGEIYSLAFSPNGRTLASGSEDETVKLWDVSSGNELRTLTGHSDEVKAVVFSLDGKTLASGSLDTTIRLWDVASGNELKERSPGDWQDDEFEFFTLMFSPSGRVLAGGIGDDTINLWDVAKVTELRSIAAQTGGVQCVAFSPDLATVATGSWKSTMIEVWDVKSRKHLRTLRGHSEGVRTLAFSHDGKMLASGGDAFIKLWDVDGGKELTSLAILDNQNWLVSTPNGLFDGSPVAWSKILWRFDNNIFDHAPVEAFFSEFYHPGLLAAVFAEKPPTAPSDISRKDRRQIPVALTTPGTRDANRTVVSRTVTLQVEVQELAAGPDISNTKNQLPSSGARDLRLFRNGSLVKVWLGDLFASREESSCKLLRQSSPQNARRSVCTATVPIVAGKNRFTAYAFNNDNVKSLDAELVATGSQILKRVGTLYVLAVGVGENVNPNFKLDYAVRDAQALSDMIRLQQQTINHYAKTDIKLLLNEQAKKEAIIAELKRLATVVQPEDGLLIYFSGHGTAEGKRFYMLPYDIGYMGPRTKQAIGKEKNLATILSHSISDEDLEQVLRTADAGQIVMVIDACHSGQALNADDPRRGPMNSTGLAQLAYEKGMYILAASQDVEVAYESRALGHSYLTYALVEQALKTKMGEADANKDGHISLREWFDYAAQEVPRLREQKVEALTVKPGVVSARIRTKQLQEVQVAERAKVQTPRPFYRREVETQPFIIAKTKANK